MSTTESGRFGLGTLHSRMTVWWLGSTPVGMQPGDPSLLDPDAFREEQFVLDLIYHIPRTPIMLAADQSGARSANGLGMLLHQGARALTIWTNREAPVSLMRRTLETAVYST